MRQKSYVENVEKRRSRVIRPRPNNGREIALDFGCRNASRSVGLGRSLVESTVRLSSRCRNGRWEAVEFRRIGSVGHVGVWIYAFRKNQVVVS